MRPNRLVVRAYVWRGARFWLAMRALVATVLLLGGTSPLLLSPVTVVELILLSVVVSFLDTHRHRERALLGNLGVHPVTLGALFAGPAIVGEVALLLGGVALR